MIKYEPVDVTKRAHEISGKSLVKRVAEDESISFPIKERIPIFESINPCNEYGKKRIYAKEVLRVFNQSSIFKPGISLKSL